MFVKNPENSGIDINSDSLVLAKGDTIELTTEQAFEFLGRYRFLEVASDLPAHEPNHVWDAIKSSPAPWKLFFRRIRQRFVRYGSKLSSAAIKLRDWKRRHGRNIDSKL